MSLSEHGLAGAALIEAMVGQDIDFKEDKEVVIDLLVDLRHFCDAHGLDFGACDSMAYIHYLEEK